MNSIEIRQQFLDFFAKKQHQIVPSAPLVIKNDPTLMFTNAGMNQFKDFFLGNAVSKYPRIANTQKCLRVSGKHNDLEDVGKDTYHHTMFEMLGNWSFGDYFKKEAIEWGWELLTEVFKIDKANLYVTVFGGDATDKLEADHEAYHFWKTIVPEDRIVYGSKKDNFWEMGDTGPCGPCSEIHIDLRNAEEKKKIPGRDLINKDHPEVIEIWNLVFIEFNRDSSGKLNPLPAKHVDTGMGFERLTRVLQGKKSNYDTDIFQPIIQEICRISGKAYLKNEATDIAIRVVADHVRAVAFAIADGQLPSNNKAGYVIRRILRRAVRYAFTFLDCKEAFIYQLIPALTTAMGNAFPELNKQRELITKVIQEEENAFLRTLAVGIQKFEHYTQQNIKNKTIDGAFAFELFDTFGFPIDLTCLMAQEKGWRVDLEAFNKAMEEQKNRSRQAATVNTGDWIELKPMEKSEFIGYDILQCDAEILKYRTVKVKDNEFCHIVLDRTPFYAESGGQVGDKGFIRIDNKDVPIINTIKENDLIIHVCKPIANIKDNQVFAQVDIEKRKITAAHHSATHLLHAALREILGSHVEQKGSLVSDEKLRFDFSHFAKLSKEELQKIEDLVNNKIRENIPLNEYRSIPIAEAQRMGAIALFGEKYGENVRVIAFQPEFSMELCGGTHVATTGNIGYFKILSESAIAAGMRRIEAVAGKVAENWIKEQLTIIEHLKETFKNAKDIVKAAQQLVIQVDTLEKKIENLQKAGLDNLKSELKGKIQVINNVNYLEVKLNQSPALIKDLIFQLKAENKNFVCIIGSVYEEKPSISIGVSDDLVQQNKFHAGNLVKQLAKEIDGGGGGQAFFATAGGKKPHGIDKALNLFKNIVLALN